MLWLTADVAQLVERRLAKAKVAGSTPVIRSTHAWKGHLWCPIREYLRHCRLLNDARKVGFLRYCLRYDK